MDCKQSFEIPDGGGFALPSARKPTESDVSVYRALGRLLCNFVIRKSVLLEAEKDIFSCCLSPFLFSFLCYEEGTVLSDISTALCALHKFDPVLCASWSKLLDMDNQQLASLLIVHI